jgi:hypothetical protein
LVLHKLPKKFFGIWFCINYRKSFSVLNTEKKVYVLR